MAKDRSYMKREDIARLIEDHVISKEAGAQILANFGKKNATEEVGLWFWILPFLGFLLIAYGLSGLLTENWESLSQQAKMVALTLGGIIGIVAFGVGCRYQPKESLGTEVSAVIASLAVIFMNVFGMERYLLSSIDTLQDLYILGIGIPVLWGIMWWLRSFGASIAYYAYLLFLLTVETKGLLSPWIFFVAGLAPGLIAYYWYREGKSLRLMFFIWAFTLVGIAFIIKFFNGMEQLGLLLSLETGCFLVSFATTNVQQYAFIAWRILGIPSLLVAAAAAWAWVGVAPGRLPMEITYTTFGTFFLGIVAVAIILWKLTFDRCARRVGYSMVVNLIVVWVLLAVRYFFLPEASKGISIFYDIFVGLQGAWIIANGVRCRSLFFINLGILVVMDFTFLLSLYYEELQAVEMSWILVAEGIGFVLGNIFFSRKYKSDRELESAIK